MEKIFNLFKTFILEDVNPTLSRYADETTPMPDIKANAVVFGSVDLDKMKQGILVSVLPETQSEDDADIGDYRQSSSFTITIVCRNAVYDVLIRQMCRYSEAFRNALLRSNTLEGVIDEIEIGERTFYPDAGQMPSQVSAVEMKLTFITNETL